MRNLQVVTMMSCCFISLAVNVHGQAKQKPGLWEVTSQMSMGGAGAPQMPQLPPGVQLPPGMQMPASPFAPHTTLVCVTQAMIDKYGGPYSNPQQGSCQLSDVSVTPSGMTAKMTCTGQLNATGTVQSTFSNGTSSKTIVHLTGTMQMGSASRPVDMTMQSTSVYKGADCGSVKPPPMPSN